MIIELKNTSTKEIADELLKARRQAGPASGMVFTLIVVADEQHRDKVEGAARSAAISHPSRVLVVTYTSGEEPRLDAEIQVGEGLPGDLIHIQISEGLRANADSVLLPLLLPDSPTVAWWPHDAPLDGAKDPIGKLATRRITDAAGSENPPATLKERAQYFAPGDTDLTWTRLTRWRSLLALALDQHPGTVTGALVKAARDNAPAALLAAWLKNRLDIEVDIELCDLPGVSEVRLHMEDGDIVLDRGRNDRIALYAVPGEPERKVALQRRGLTVLITEELERLDPDVAFEAAINTLAAQEGA